MNDKEFQSRLLSLPNPSSVIEFDLAVNDLLKSGTREQRKVLLDRMRMLPQSERPTPEIRLCRALSQSLRGTVEGEVFLEARELQVALVGLEYFLPPILAEVYPNWKAESLDGFYLSEARKTGFSKAELRGVCILLADQTITPFHVRLQIARSGDEINWMECRLGKRGSGTGDMERIPWSRWHDQPYTYLQDSLKPIDWTFKVAFGKEYD